MSNYLKLTATLFISIIMFFSCSDNTAILSSEQKSLENSLEIKTSWEGFNRITYQRETSHGQPVIFHLYTPNEVATVTPLLIAIHGSTSSKLDWGVINGYAKGGNLTKELLKKGYRVIAVDLAYHGEHYLNSKGWNWTNSEEYDSVYINHWSYFHEETILGIEPVLEFVKNSDLFDIRRTGIVCYSLGGYFINQVAQLHGSIKSLTYLVASTGYRPELSPEYGPVKNQANLEKANVYVVAAENDEYIPLSESQWLYDNLNMGNKKFVTYPGGHSLPVDYVNPLVEWLTGNL